MVVLSLIGVFGGLFISGQTLSFSSVVGIIALSGVIINHAIILTDSIHRIAMARKDLPARDIIIEAAVSRLRPIVLTTIATVIGMIPLAGATALWGPLAFAIMFGLAFSMILTLVMIPILTYRWPEIGSPGSETGRERSYSSFKKSPYLSPRPTMWNTMLRSVFRLK